MRKAFAAAAILGLIATAALAVDPPKADYSTPRATVKTLYYALLTGDVAGAKACWNLPSAEAGANLEENLMPVVGPMMIRRAVAEKMPEKLADYDKATGVQNHTTMVEGVLKSIDATSVTDMGEAAAVELKEDDPSNPGKAPPQRKMILLKKVGNDWKVTSHPYAGTDAPPAQYKAVAAAQAKMFQDLANEVRAGKFKDEKEILAAWNARTADLAKLAPQPPVQPGQPAQPGQPTPPR